MSNSFSGFKSGSDRRFAVKDGGAVPTAYEESTTAAHKWFIELTIWSFTYSYGASTTSFNVLAHSRAVLLKPVPGNQSGSCRTEFNTKITGCSTKLCIKLT